MERMRIGLILLLSLLLPPNLLATSGARAGAANGGMIVPSITVSDAVGGNPATVYTSGQAPRTITVAWNAGSDYSYCEIYFTINDADQKELGRDHDGAKPITVTAGNAYHFWMVIYPGGGQVKVVTELRIVAQQGVVPAPPPPASPSAADAGAGISDAISDRGPVAKVYRVAINNVRVDPGPHHFIMRFNGQPNEVPYVAIGVAPAITRNNELIFGDNLIGGGFVGIGTVSDAEKAKGQYMFASSFGNTFSEQGLEAGRTYYYIITVPAPGRQRTQTTGQFTMMVEATTVEVVWERVRIEDDSDDLSTGEIGFWLWANYGQPGGKISMYSNGDADTGHTYDINQPVVIENASTLLTLSASGRDDDSGFANAGFVPAGIPDPLNGPANKGAADENVAKGEFDLTQSAEGEWVPFSLSSMPGGSLRFAVSGHFKFTRKTVMPGAGNIGTTSSGLTTAPAPDPVHPQNRIKSPPASGPLQSICDLARQARARNSPAAPGLEEKCRAAGAAGEIAPVKPQARVKVDPTAAPTGPSRPICDIARVARARNSPAAPGLEQSCRAELAAKGLAIAQVDPIVAAARTAESDSFYQQGFDIATAIFGDPALGAWGRTETGPGSLGIRDALSASGQRGFNASVKLHLSRKYE
jgi:hypothetical protein